MKKRPLIVLAVSAGLALTGAATVPAFAALGGGGDDDPGSAAPSASASPSPSMSASPRPAVPKVTPKPAATPRPKRPGPARPPARFKVRGVISAVNASAWTLTFADRKGVTTTFAVAATARITIDGAAVALVALPADLRAEISGTVAKGTRTVTVIDGSTRVPSCDDPDDKGGLRSGREHGRDGDHHGAGRGNDDMPGGRTARPAPSGSSTCVAPA